MYKFQCLTSYVSRATSTSGVKTTFTNSAKADRGLALDQNPLLAFLSELLSSVRVHRFEGPRQPIIP